MMCSKKGRVNVYIKTLVTNCDINLGNLKKYFVFSYLSYVTKTAIF